MTEKMIAYCGLDCAVCPAFHAAERLTIPERQKIADQWSKEFNTTFGADQIDCVGCIRTDGPHVGYCSICAIRSCGMERKLITCAACIDYGCDKLEAFLKNVPQAK